MTLHERRTSFDWAGLGWTYLFFWYFSGVTHVLLLINDAASFSGFRQALLMSFLWLAPVLAFPQKARAIAAVIGTLLGLSGLAGLGYYCIYGQEFSQSVIFIMFESNLAESSEYLQQYLNLKIPLVLIGYLLGGWLLWHKVRPVYLPAGALRAVVPALIVLAVLGYPLQRGYVMFKSTARALDHLERRMEPAVPWQLVVGYHQYRKQLDNMQELLKANSAVPPLKELVDRNAGNPSTIVLVIGESTNRNRMALYGYKRDTSPELGKLRDQLDVFRNVIAPRPYTIETLQEVLTFADQQHPDDWLTTPSALNMMKQAGYKTFWATNQQTMTARNTMLTTFSQQADEQVYLNNNRAQNARSYDSVLVEPFKRMLADPAPRKFIVLHMLGTHMTYRYRYPEEAAKFTNRDGVPAWVTDDQLEDYNAYDNAVRYNDGVVASLIREFSATDPHGFLVYFSDHGESVYDSPTEPVIGRNEASPTAPMYTIPFMVWRSPSWKRDYPADWSALLERPYASMHFIHTLAEISGLHFKEFDAAKSLINPGYRDHPLLIGNPANPSKLRDFRSLPDAGLPYPAKLAEAGKPDQGAGRQAQ